ncbi:MAG: HmuY family protein [Rubricoccaceae bacterium]
MPRLVLLTFLLVAVAGCDSAIEPRADLSLAATADATELPAVGDVVTFTFTLSNAGPNPSTGAVVRITPAATLADVRATPTTGGYSGDRWTVPGLAVGADAVLTVTARVAATGPAEVTGEVIEAREPNPSANPALRATAAVSSVLRATVRDIFAPTVGVPPATGGRFAFYSLRENRLVLSATDTGARADSASTAWDIAFRGTTILVNGGSSGPGQGAALIAEAPYASVAEAPADGYRVDAPGQPAIPGGSGNGWYVYNAQTNVIAPIAGRTLIIRTADGRFAKLRIVSYYRGAPATPNGFQDAARYYTFEYVFQPDPASRRFQ